MSKTADECRCPPSPAGSRRLPHQKQRQQHQTQQPSPCQSPTPPSADGFVSDDSVADTAANDVAIKAHLAALLRSYCTHIDAGCWRAWGDVFAEDAVLSFEYFGQLRGRQEIVCAASGMAGFSCGTTLFSDVSFTLDARCPGERAVGSANLWYKSDDEEAPTAHKMTPSSTPTSLQVISNEDTEGPRVGYGYCGPYHFDFVRTDQGWKIKEMAMKVLSEHGEEGDQRCTRCDRIPPSRCGTPCC